MFVVPICSTVIRLLDNNHTNVFRFQFLKHRRPHKFSNASCCSKKEISNYKSSDPIWNTRSSPGSFFHNVIDASQTLEDKLHREQGQQILSVVGILIQTMCCYKSRFCIWAFASECSFLIAVKKNKSKKNEHKYQRGGKAART